MVTREEFLRASREISRLSDDWPRILLYVTLNQRDAVAVVLRRIHGGDLDVCQRVVWKLEEQLAAACIHEGAVTYDGSEYASAHEAAVGSLHLLLTSFTDGFASSDNNALIQPEQLLQAWEYIREYYRQYPRAYAEAPDLTARLKRERVIVAEKLPAEEWIRGTTKGAVAKAINPDDGNATRVFNKAKKLYGFNHEATPGSSLIDIEVSKLPPEIRQRLVR